MVMKEVAKQIEFQKPNITEPFTSTSHPIRLTSGKSETRARIMQKYLNAHFTGNFDRQEFMEQLSDVMLREGTVWVRTGWDFREENNSESIDSISMEDILARGDNPANINQNEDGTFKVDFDNFEMTHNEPTAEVLRNEHVFPDPAARTMEDCRFIIHRKHMTISELRETGIYDEKQIDKLSSIKDADANEDTDLGNVRNSDNREYGADTTYQPLDEARKKIVIIEYWGYYDLNGDGIAEPIVATWADKDNINLRIEENPMPSKAIPFFREVYSARPFSLWGNALAYFIGDNQIIKSSLMRGILDNMSNSNNGQKFITRGSIDYPNLKKMRNGEKIILVNKPDGIQDGSYNNLPNSVFQTLQMVDADSQELSGVSSGSPALNNSALAKDDSDAQLTMSQQRMASTVRGVGNLIRKIMKEWLLMAEIFLSNEQIEGMFTAQEQRDILAFQESKHQQINVKVGTEVVRGQRIQQLNLLMQQAKVLGDESPPDTINALVAEMFELFDMYEKAEGIRSYEKPPPSQEQQMMMQLELQEKQLSVQKIQAEIVEIQSRANSNAVKDMTNQMDAQANMGYKGSQTAEKYAKTQGTKVDTALKPVETLQSIEKKEINKG
ncbi:MAG: hypothetical protein GQ570_08605 [Helicobacteraceae bacterium]|nr:hypothetical protein [Helicobacteraceae bacterium]